MKYPIEQHKEIPTECMSCSVMGCGGKKDPADEYGTLYAFFGTAQDRNHASFGLALTKAGEGKKVLFYSFIKKEEEGMDAILEQIPTVDHVPTLPTKRFVFMMEEEEKEEAKQSNEQKLEELFALSREYDMLVLDDVFYVISMGFLEEEKLIQCLKTKSQQLDVVMTGKEAPEKVLSMAEYVTKLDQIRHPKFIF